MKIFNIELFKKKPKEPELKAPKPFPNSDNVEQWMIEYYQYFKKKYPEEYYWIFSPASADYIPLCVHVGTNWYNNQKAQECYKALRSLDPEAVKKAKKETNGLAGYMTQSRVQYWEDARDDGYFPQ